ncbi:MAG: hypothetical protein KatS3mg023_3189 [Armatimonadota bacterium]|nr:MAG: hypothetical protein KatS3mg023_3189 [Armatimonadota bacterium]
MSAGYPDYALSALGMYYAAALIGFCFSVAGFVIAFLPDKAWRTKYKPRWPGILLLAGGLYLLVAGIVGAWQIRQEVTRRRTSENSTGRNIARTVDYDYLGRTALHPCRTMLSRWQKGDIL